VQAQDPEWMSAKKEESEQWYHAVRGGIKNRRFGT
jgi:hypothetical protein